MNFFKFSALVSILTLCLFSISFLAGCPEEVTEDHSISEITIYNIPEYIKVNGNPAESAPAFKVYVNASDSQKDTDPPAAKGLAKVSDDDFDPNTHTYTVTIQLQKPNPKDETDPNYNTGSWSGTAKYFSVMISPEYRTEDRDNAVWAKGSLLPLNKGKKLCNWDGLLSFRGQDILNIGYTQKTRALYNQIIIHDTELKGPADPAGD